MFGKVKSLFGQGKREKALKQSHPTIETILEPERPFWAIGDIHGNAVLLDALLEKMRAEGAAEQVIFLGDYVDRGQHSSDVLAQIFKMQQECPDNVVCLMGNHEKMLLEFIDDPLGRGARWLANGGLETLASFGISGVKKRPDAEDAIDAADALEDAMPAGLQAWLRNLPMHWSSGNMHCVHAAMDPAKPVSRQREEVLLWGHRDFMKVPRSDGQSVVFGHVIVPKANVHDGRIAVDTGAYKTGRLTAALVEHGSCRFVST